MEKCFLDSEIEQFPSYEGCTAMRGMQTSFQLLYRESDTRSTVPYSNMLGFRYSGELAPYTRARAVELIPSTMPVYPGLVDDNYLRTQPGLYPDLLREMHYRGSVPLFSGQARALWFDVLVPENAPLCSGKHTVEIEIYRKDEELGEGEVLARHSFTVELLDLSMPERDFPVTQWLHCDCLADYYNVPVFSEEHWRIIENFVKLAVKNGNTMLLTPVFTPPLDTEVGTERPTVQLVDVILTGGSYSFGYEKLDRWLDMCRRVGVRYYEISHLFSQWGARYAPKVVALVDGTEKRIFGWDTEGTGEEYVRFMDAFLPDFLAHMKAIGEDKKCFFHISDEPTVNSIDGYRRARDVVKRHLEGYTVMDALSSYDFYELGLVETPIPSNDHMQSFIENKVENLWTYYCCGQTVGVSNRMFAMPGWRTRYMGVQMYYYNIKGFLQWGYNFYYSRRSTDLINPFIETTGDGFFPSGDGFSVYPASDGTALESVRIRHFCEGLDDMRLCRYAESLVGRDAIISLIESIFGKVDFKVCPRSREPILKLRERLFEIIKKNK